MYSEKKQENISKEFCRLKDMCYLDHVGATLYAESQIKAVVQDLNENVYGNPHSLSTCSRFSTDIVDQVRYRVLHHFNTDPDEYSIIFTSGATQALKIVAESFHWTINDIRNNNIQNDESLTSQNEAKEQRRPNTETCSVDRGSFVYLQDNHTSVLGMRELAARNGANVHCLSHEEAFKCFHNFKCSEIDLSTCESNSLFVYPAQCNFSGVKYPLCWVSRVQHGILSCKTKCKSQWFCLLDAASFVSTNPLDLSQVKPDFVCISFYKIFGYPTGLGALLVKNSSASVLKRNYFGGGTVLISLSSQRVHVPRPGLSDSFEDGTIPFLSIMALQHGFNALQTLTGGMSSVARHTFSLARYLFQFLLTLHHSNGSPAAIIYCDTDYDSIYTQGSVVNFNMLRPNGECVGFIEVLNMANLHGIQLRTGCFCNPGACQRHLLLSDDDLKSHFQAGHICGDERDLINGQPTGSIRVSFGYMTTKENLDKLIDMLTTCFVQGTPVKKIPVWWPAFQQSYLYKFQCVLEKQNGPLEGICWNVPDECLKTIPQCFTVTSQTNLDTPKNGLILKKAEEDAKSCDILYSISKLTHIFIYPVKSCGAIRVNSWVIGQRGFLYDREWMVVTEAGVCLTQKQDTKLCRIQPSIDLSRKLLILQFPGRQKPVLSLSNQAQFLLLNESSIQWLSDQIDQNESDCDKENLLQRFRSNLVVQAAQPFAENDWTILEIGDVKFHCEGPCTRCQMICINQSSGEKTREPLSTLARSLHGKIRFGIYLSHETKANVKIAVGDKVTCSCSVK